MWLHVHFDSPLNDHAHGEQIQKHKVPTGFINYGYRVNIYGYLYLLEPLWAYIFLQFSILVLLYYLYSTLWIQYAYDFSNCFVFHNPQLQVVLSLHFQR